MTSPLTLMRSFRTSYTMPHRMETSRTSRRPATTSANRLSRSTLLPLDDVHDLNGIDDEPNAQDVTARQPRHAPADAQRDVAGEQRRSADDGNLSSQHERGSAVQAVAVR